MDHDLNIRIKVGHIAAYFHLIIRFGTDL